MIGIGCCCACQLIKARILRHIVRRHGGSDMADLAEANRHGKLLQSEPERALPDVPLHKRGFGVMDEQPA